MNPEERTQQITLFFFVPVETILLVCDLKANAYFSSIFTYYSRCIQTQSLLILLMQPPKRCNYCRFSVNHVCIHHQRKEENTTRQ